MKPPIIIIILLFVSLFTISCNTGSQMAAEKAITEDSVQSRLVKHVSHKNEWENPQRFIAMDGAKNFRDLGGYTTEDGEQTAWNKLYRSEKLSELSENDVEKIASLGIKTVVDLRCETEKKKDVSRLPEGMNRIEIPIWREEWNFYLNLTPEGLDSLMKAADNPSRNEEAMAGTYKAFPVEFQAEVKQFIEVLAEENNYPVLFHCTAGTDRTGFLAAMTLSLLKVPEETIIEDYALSKKLRLNAPEKDTRIVYSLEKIKEHGGVKAYLTNVVGASEEDFKKIQDNLVK